MSTRNFLTRLDKVALMLNPPIQEIAFPTVYQLDDGSDYPGYEEQNAAMIHLARRRGMNVESYSSTREDGPWWEMDGIEL